MTETQHSRKGTLGWVPFLLVSIVVVTVWGTVNQIRLNKLDEHAGRVAASCALALDSLRTSESRALQGLRGAIHVNDSLLGILEPMEPYRPLVAMLAYRDSVQRGLPYAPGDRVICLPDSLPAIVREVHITGSGPSFGLNYSIALKGGEDRIVPAILLATP